MSHQKNRIPSNGPQGQVGEQQTNVQIFRAWHDQYRGRLLNSMTAMVRDRDAAEDVTAAALEAAFANLERFRGESSLDTWVHAIALNQARDYLRRNRGVSLEALDGREPNEFKEPDRLEDILDSAECRVKLRKALRKVPSLYRRTLVDHFVHGYSVKWIAQRDRVPVGTVLSRIFNGKRLLRQGWET
jgi:RNA polymerase sigma-70 factor, ECF subfamily